ncbi:hypothetical protein DM02DRAFT_698002 [Periconia macrospinosa]|uniref:Zn(2)-C6 fungal-type domain-containing protein n=1 Tax=Periconia macrospinosa TaxID=97972 RepID=A0A2V1D5V9_9PLEO|nr:hypothetical protein DM02DRAFT_698002 [Periconia macrospinosa]
MRPLLPRVGPPPPHNEGSKKRRRNAVACGACRERKSACSGDRPQCTSCVQQKKECRYRTAEGSETESQALKREHRSLSGLLEYLRTAPEDTAQALFHEIRSSTTTHPIVSRFEKEQIWTRPFEQATAMATLPHIENETELKLIIQYQAAYPVLDLSCDAVLSKNELFDFTKILPPDLRLRTRKQPESNEKNELHSSGISPALPSPAQQDQLQPENDLQRGVREQEPSISSVFFPLSSCLNISYWTSVPVTNHYAASAISLYFEIDHPVTGWFDKVSFLNDLIHLRSNNCSAFLVNSLLACASQTYSHRDKAAKAKSYEFEKEAEMLQRADRADSVCAVAGLILLYTCKTRRGEGGKDALKHVADASEMAQRMKMFGVRAALDPAANSSSTQEDLNAFAQTAWGVFHQYNICVHFHIAPPLEFPPSVSVPEHTDLMRYDDKARKFRRVGGFATVRDEAFAYLCRLNRIDCEALFVLRKFSRPPPLAFALSKYGEFLNLMDGLPERLHRSANAPAIVLAFHMLFHQAVMDLFRPYLTIPGLNAIPRNLWAASTKQLKGLVIEYICQQPNAFNEVFWHGSLIYLANAVLRPSSDQDWRFYFLLCMYGFSKAYPSHSFAKGAIQSLLRVATTQKAISEKDAVNIQKVLFLGIEENEVPVNINAYAADLDLAMRDPERAATAVLVNEFEELTVLDEFTVGVVKE